MATRQCVGVDCKKEASALECPKCIKLGLKDNYFCSQDCFKKSWSTHIKVHKAQITLLENLLRPKATSVPDPETGKYDPFPTYAYKGPLRAEYPLSATRTVPEGIAKPDYATHPLGKSASEEKVRDYSPPKILSDAEVTKKDGTKVPSPQDGMRKVCRLAREVLDIAEKAAVPGVTTDYIDEVVHKACIERGAYPSPLNYYQFPKSVCTSPNEIICHGIPDQRVLQDGDILNIDVTLYHGGFHGDLNATYYIGPKAKADKQNQLVVETARECLNEAIKHVKPGTAFSEFGNVIEKYAKSKGCSVIRDYCGHGINDLFHCPPMIPHYAGSKKPGRLKAGMCFTIEPMIALGSWKAVTWPDNWTSSTYDGKRTAQFEHTILVTDHGCEILTAHPHEYAHKLLQKVDKDGNKVFKNEEGKIPDYVVDKNGEPVREFPNVCLDVGGEGEGGDAAGSKDTAEAKDAAES